MSGRERRRLGTGQAVDAGSVPGLRARRLRAPAFLQPRTHARGRTALHGPASAPALSSARENSLTPLPTPPPTLPHSYCYYPGRNKDFLVSNAIFRAGGAAMLMTNKRSLYSRCKYELHSSTRVHTGQDDTAYR